MGPFSNEEGHYTNHPGFENGHWYLSEKGELFIVPNAEADIEGGDDQIITKLNAAYRSKPFIEVDPNVVAGALDLEFVPDVFRRFDEAIGYYCC